MSRKQRPEREALIAAAQAAATPGTEMPNKKSDAHGKTPRAAAGFTDAAENLRAQLDDAMARISQLEAALTEHHEKSEALAAAWEVERAALKAAFDAERDALGLRAARLQKNLGADKAALAAIQTSKIWWLRAPLRAIMQIARPIQSWRSLHVSAPSMANGYASSTLSDPAGSLRGWVQIEVKTDSGVPIAGPLMLRLDCADGRVLAFQIKDNAPGPFLLRLPDNASALTLETEIDANPSGKVVSVRARLLGKALALAHIVRTRPADGYRALRTALRGHGKAALEQLNAPHKPSGIVDFERWVRFYDTPTPEDLDRLHARAIAMADPPRFSIITPVYNTPPQYLREMIQSVRAQAYPHWELCLADDASPNGETRNILADAAKQDQRIKITYRATNGNISAASNSALALAGGSHLALLDHDDVLPAQALAIAAQEISKAPLSDIFYSDEDKIDDQGRRFDPYFKPDWNEELIYAQNYANHLTIYRAEPVRALSGFRIGFEGSQDYDLLLRMVAKTRKKIVHIPHILYHWRIFQGAGNFSLANMRAATLAARRAIGEKFLGDGVQVEVLEGSGGYHRLKRPAPRVWPKVSVIIPTRDYAEVLQVCIDGLFNTTDYPDLEIIVVDNGSKAAETFAYFKELEKRGVRILPAPGAFNFSRLNNMAAREAKGEILLLLNNDISMLSPGWLKEMIIHAVRPEIGAVGARLLYPDGSLQHGGVVLGIGGVAGHLHQAAPADEPGYFARLKLAQEISCVTAACMATPKRVYDALGGLDETNLAVAFNDVDYCVRVRAAGHKIIWTPHAELTHWESKSRGSDQTPETRPRFLRESGYMRARWGETLDADPYYNPNLDLYSGVPRPAFPPRVPRPWA